jgi:aspartate aminotransferase
MSVASERVTRMLANSSRPTALASGNGLVSLALGEPDFDTHPAIVEAARSAALAGHTHYTDFAGDPELRTALADEVSAGTAGRVSPASVIVTHGATAAISAVLLGLVDAGDRVVIPDPTYSLYADVTRLAGGQVDLVPALPNGQPDVDRLCERTGGARLVVLCNPNNPTGAVMSRDDLEAIADAADRADCFVLADEAYKDLVYDGIEFHSTARLTQFADRVIYVQTFSKSYAMTGWRVGYVVAPDRALEAVKAVHRSFNGANNSVAQRAALAALRLGAEVRAGMLPEYSFRRSMMLALLDDVPGVTANPPQGAFYVFVRLPRLLTADVATEAFRRHGVTVRPGTEYGPAGEGHIRLSFAADRAAITEAMSRIRRAMDQISAVDAVDQEV